jgi:hypothetical protein
VKPHGEIDVIVLARDGTQMEVDGPAAEEPVGEAAAIEKLTYVGQR